VTCHDRRGLQSLSVGVAHQEQEGAEVAVGGTHLVPCRSVVVQSVMTRGGV
jgi:hypothetical protein